MHASDDVRDQLGSVSVWFDLDKYEKDNDNKGNRRESKMIIRLCFF
jgi:hypothetical protein